MKYRFKTRFGRWLHCLVRFHRPATARPAGSGSVFVCFDCLLKHQAAVDKLKFDMGLRG